MASCRGTGSMIAHFAPDEDRRSWLQTLVDIRKLPERRVRGRWS
jgi:hypothetical protein